MTNKPPEALSSKQIKHMVNRFLTWRLPENFNPDGGITFKPTFNENTDHPMRAEPIGTNLFNYTQAEEMVRHMVDGMPGGASDTKKTKPPEALSAEREANLRRIVKLCPDKSCVNCSQKREMFALIDRLRLENERLTRGLREAKANNVTLRSCTERLQRDLAEARKQPPGVPEGMRIASIQIIRGWGPGDYYEAKLEPIEPIVPEEAKLEPSN